MSWPSGEARYANRPAIRRRSTSWRWAGKEGTDPFSPTGNSSGSLQLLDIGQNAKRRGRRGAERLGSGPEQDFGPSGRSPTRVSRLLAPPVADAAMRSKAYPRSRFGDIGPPSLGGAEPHQLEILRRWSRASASPPPCPPPPEGAGWRGSGVEDVDLLGRARAFDELHGRRWRIAFRSWRRSAHLSRLWE